MSEISQQPLESEEDTSAKPTASRRIRFSMYDERNLTRPRATSYSSDAHTLSPEEPHYSTFEPRPTTDVIDQSRAHDVEKVVEISPEPGRYLRLNTLLGKGAYKIVYKAIDREEGYEVAWNSMQFTNVKDLAHEIEILKSVRHPNIIAFHDAWQNDTEFVFITELMTSGTLREYIRKLSLPNIKIVKRWARQILKGLVYLHGHNPPIIHRDIKCDNIFINGAYGEVKIGDMGTAEMRMGKKYTVIGTPEFMAPEMYEEHGYNEKVDIYAFGMCLLEMTTVEYPYGECTNPAQVYKKVTAGIKPASLAKVQNHDVLGVIENCLGPEEERMSAQQILEYTFFAIEPEVVLLTTDPNNVHLTLQVAFKGVDKRSVKFDFNVESDTAGEVVQEMIEEEILPKRYQQHITKEISRILRELDKESEHVNRSIWRRESDGTSELERVKAELEHERKCVAEKEAQCELYEIRASKAEERCLEVTKLLHEIMGESGSEDEHRSLSTPFQKGIYGYICFDVYAGY
ncbi:kinase-like domain-containing protein [Dichotomocladium elegans]|nr:kinase-like domain-containing protein [Dichotomocladium elegans]